MANKDKVILNYNEWYLNYHSSEAYKLEVKKKFRTRHLNNNNIENVKNVQIEITNRCNFACTMCPLDDIKSPNKSIDMTLNEFKNIINKLPKSVTKINMQGLGESYLHNDFLEMLKYAKEKNLFLWNINNGSLFNMKTIHYLDEIWFSLDSVISQELENIRKNIKTNELFETIKNTISYIKKHNLKNKVKIYTAVNKTNWESVEYLYEFCNEYNIDELHINPTVNNYRYDSIKYNNMEKSILENLTIDWNIFSKKYISKNYNFNLTIWYPRREMKGLCVWGFDTIYIDKNSNIISCCRQVTHPIIFGNLANQSFEAIYNGEAMRNFRDNHISNKPLPICDNCSMGIPV